MISCDAGQSADVVPDDQRWPVSHAPAAFEVLPIRDLASTGRSDQAALKRAMAYGTVIASFNVEDFSLNRFQCTGRDEIERRFESYRTMMSF
jgi:hypothetical protein